MTSSWEWKGQGEPEIVSRHVWVQWWEAELIWLDLIQFKLRQPVHYYVILWGCVAVLFLRQTTVLVVSAKPQKQHMFTLRQQSPWALLSVGSTGGLVLVVSYFNFCKFETMKFKTTLDETSAKKASPRYIIKNGCIWSRIRWDSGAQVKDIYHLLSSWCLIFPPPNALPWPTKQKWSGKRPSHKHTIFNLSRSLWSDHRSPLSDAFHI